MPIWQPALDRTRVYSLTAFEGLDGATATVPGLAIPGQLADALIANLATALADRESRCRGDATRAYHVGFGLRARLDLGGASSGDLQLDAAIRVDAKQVALGGTTNPPPHGAPVVHVHANVTRSGGWLLGSADMEPGRRLRRLELGLSLQADSAGNLAAVPMLRLHNAGDADWIDLPGIVTRLSSSPPTLPLDGPRPEPARPTRCSSSVPRARSRGVGCTGALALALDELAAAAAQPIDWLGPRMPALLDVVGAAQA